MAFSPLIKFLFLNLMIKIILFIFRLNLFFISYLIYSLNILFLFFNLKIFQGKFLFSQLIFVLFHLALNIRSKKIKEICSKRRYSYS